MQGSSWVELPLSEDMQGLIALPLAVSADPVPEAMPGRTSEQQTGRQGFLWDLKC